MSDRKTEIQVGLPEQEARRPESGYGLSLIADGVSWQGTKATIIEKAISDMLRHDYDGAVEDVVVYEEGPTSRTVTRISGDVVEVNSLRLTFAGGREVELDGILAIHF
ncbi:hypothetical protein [Micromonospora sp. NPDC047730]|uniref:hypothetical protein n=1 Tax=Micromonospora sp. NPDC047730 TaxID=3364253 RepID=UPI0037247A3C